MILKNKYWSIRGKTLSSSYIQLINTIVIFFSNTLRRLKIFLLRQESYLLLTSTNFNLLKISFQNKRTRVIYVHLWFLNQNLFDSKNLNRDQIFEILWNFKVLIKVLWKFLLGKFPPIKLPPGKFPPPRKISTQKIRTWNIPTHFIVWLSSLFLHLILRP